MPISDHFMILRGLIDLFTKMLHKKVTYTVAYSGFQKGEGVGWREKVNLI